MITLGLALLGLALIVTACRKGWARLAESEQERRERERENLAYVEWVRRRDAAIQSAHRTEALAGKWYLERERRRRERAEHNEEYTNKILRDQGMEDDDG